MVERDCFCFFSLRLRPPYQTGKTVHVHAKHYKHNEDGRAAPGVCGNGFVPLNLSGNVVTRIGIHTHTATKIRSRLHYTTHQRHRKTTGETQTFLLYGMLNVALFDIFTLLFCLLYLYLKNIYFLSVSLVGRVM